MITSLTNPKIKLVRRLLSERRTRQREKAFVAEGTRWLEDALGSGERPLFCLATPQWQEKNPTLSQHLTELGKPPLTIDSALAQQIAETETPSGVLTVLAQPELAWPKRPELVLILDGLQDPGNIGTLIRTATAAGVSGLLLMPGCVDPFNPKVTRSTMGALLRLPIRHIKWPDLRHYCPDCDLYIAAGEGNVWYSEVDWRQPAALIIGNEAHGVGGAARSYTHTAIAIPMVNQTESLNAAVAGSIILYEAVRQRRAILLS